MAVLFESAPRAPPIISGKDFHVLPLLQFRKWLIPSSRATMTNALNAKLVRVTTRALGGSVPNQMPLTAEGDNRFDVVVEGIAGNLLSASGQPYSLDVVAFDISAGTNPHSGSNNFTQKRLEEFDAVNGWPSKVATFTVTLDDIAAVQGHLLRYYAILTSANQVASFVESPLFLLYRHDLKVGAAPPTDVESALLNWRNR